MNSNLLLKKALVFWICLLNLFLLAVIGVLDYQVGVEVSVVLIYLIPVSLSAWFIGKNAGIVTAFLCGSSYLLTNHLQLHSVSSSVLYWNTGMKTGTFLAFSMTVSYVKNLIDHLNEERYRSEQLSWQLIRSQEEDRKRIARELHDEASQALATLTLRIEALKRKGTDPSALHVAAQDLDELKAIAEQVLTELRRLAFNLRPVMLEEMGLRRSLSSLFRKQLGSQGIDVAFQSEGDETRLLSDIELVVFRIAQEAVSNIVRHSKATRVDAAIHWTPTQFVFMIKDNGIGFNSAILNKKKSLSLGFFGMKERILLVSGQFDLQTSPGKGTAIFITVPLSPQSYSGKPTSVGFAESRVS